MSAKERHDYVVRCHNAFVDLGERWNNRLSLNDPRLVERYRSGLLHIHVHFSLPGGFALCQVISARDCERERPFRHASGLGVVVSSSDDHWRAVTDGKLHHHGHQKMVLVGNTELVEDPQGLPIPSRVRFQAFDQVHCSFRGVLYFSPNEGFVFLGRGLGLSGDREGCAHGRPDVRARPGQDELTRQQVQGRTEVVNNIPDEGAPPLRWNAEGYVYANQILTEVRARLDCRSIKFIFTGEELVESGVQITDVLFGPFDLYPSTGTEISGCDSDDLARFGCFLFPGGISYHL